MNPDPRIPSGPSTRLEIRWQEAAWSVAVAVVPAVRAGASCRSVPRARSRSLARNQSPKRFDP
jgi:hypothetical protein